MILPLGAFSIFLNLPRSGLSYIDVGHAFIVQALNLPGIHGRSFSETRVRTWRQPTSTHRVRKEEKGISGGRAVSSGCGRSSTLAFGGVGEARTTLNFFRDE